MEPVLHPLIDKVEELPQRKLHKTESRQLKDLIPFVLYSAGLQPDYKVIWITDNVKRLTGFTPHQFKDDSGFWLSRVHPDDRERTLQTMERSLTADSQFVEYRWRCADGKYRWFLDTFSYLMDEAGKSIEMVGCWFDISKRKSFEESMSQLASIIDSSDDAIVSLTLQGSVVSWNASAAKTYGYSSAEMIGQPIFKLLVPKRRDEFKSIIESVSTGTPFGHQESIHRTKWGNTIDVALTISPVKDVTSTITGISFIARDISEKKRLEQELIQITQKYNEDLRLLTHALQQAQEEERRRVSRELHDDLNQRLSNLKLSIEMLVRSTPRKRGSVIEHLQGFAQQLDAMIRDVRKIAANLRPTILDDFGLAVGIELLCRDFEKLHHRTVMLHTIHCISRRFNTNVEIALYRIAQESFTNIAKHSNATAVDVKLLFDESSLKMIIHDNGKGFDLREVRSRKGLARGLGFTGMRERIETVGGRFHIESSPTIGTTIEAEIPIESCTKQP